MRRALALLALLFAAGCLGGREPMAFTGQAADYAGGGRSIGSADAPVTIVEFSDYQCPFCGSFERDTMPMIRGDYIDTGKARLVFRNFPLDFHGYARKAAEAAECAGEQGRFWEMHGRLFAGQDSLGDESYRRWAQEIGLDAANFSACLDGGAMAAKVDGDLAAARALGISGTPTFLINGRALEGARPYSAFKDAIDAELAG
jgi:protein-disulfide isomerase